MSIFFLINTFSAKINERVLQNCDSLGLKFYLAHSLIFINHYFGRSGIRFSVQTSFGFFIICFWYKLSKRFTSTISYWILGIYLTQMLLTVILIAVINYKIYRFIIITGTFKFLTMALQSSIKELCCSKSLTDGEVVPDT